MAKSESDAKKGWLQAVEPIDVEVVADHEERDLRGDRPPAHQPVPRRTRPPVDPADQQVDDQGQEDLAKKGG
ncbi:MAG: hypothetical protein LC775_00315 [Acidobacteria bacterium]|nr:hypothetical protein [Acidobacteriota bacterium]